MRAVQTLAVWNIQGRTDNDLPGHRPITDTERIRVMVDNGYNSSRAQLDSIRNEVEVQRLQILAERQLVEQKQAELEYEKQQLETEKQEFEEKGARAVAGTAGQALLVEEEVKRRLKEEKAREEYEKNAIEQGGIDHDLRALQTFSELRDRQEINYDHVTDEDALADSMLVAENLD